jgi:hypothetical protein
LCLLTVNKSRWYSFITMMRSKVFHTTIIVLLLVMVTAVAATPIHDSVNELRQSVIALDHARRRAVDDLNQKQQHTILNEQERRDYKKFITFLSAKIGEYCHQLISEQGESATAGLPCPAGGQALFDTQTDPISTSNEQIAELDKILAESLGQFDESLLKEDERLAARQPRDRETGYGSIEGQGNSSGGQYGGQGEVSGEAQGNSRTTETSGIEGQASEEAGATGSGTEMGDSTTGSGDRTGAVPGKGAEAGTGHGSEQSGETTAQVGRQELETGYDDIVARQLREAAEKETDPELKKKLWEEYRKYKEEAQ